MVRRMGERESKRARVHAILDAGAFDAIVVRDPANLAWYLEGARVHVVPGEPIAGLRVTRDAEELRTRAIEAPRLTAEERGAEAPSLAVSPWWEPLGPDGDASTGSDRPRGAQRDVAGELMAARSALTEAEIERYRALCRDTAAATGAA